VQQRRGGSGLAEEPLEITGRGPVIAPEAGDLQRHQAVELGVAGLVDRAHASLTQRPEDLIPTERLR
jgi:hypothetical protein